MSEFKEYMELGSQYGLEGKDLLDFAQSRVDALIEERRKNEEREDRLINRQQEKLRLELENQRVLAELASKKETAELENQRVLAEIASKERIEMEKLKIQASAQSVNDSQGTTTPTSHTPKDIYRVRLPYIRDEDSLHDALKRFEDSMRAAKIDEREYVSRLRDILTGNLLRTFLDFTDAERASFETVKEKLLESKNLNEEGYRKLFNRLLPEANFSFGDYSNKLKSTFTRWLEISHTKTFEQLVELMIKNKLLETINPLIATFLIERSPPTLKEFVHLGQSFIQAHENIQVRKEQTPLPFSATQPFPAGAAFQTPNTSVNKQKKWSKPKQTYIPPERGTQESQNTSVKQPFMLNLQTHCMYCNSGKHTSDRCPQKFNRRDPDTDGKGSKGYKGRSFTGCFICQGPHYQKDCQYRISAIGNACTTNTQTHKMDIVVKPQIIYPTTSSIPQPLDIQLHKGYLNGQLVNTLYDSGANIIGVARKLIARSDMTGRYAKCRSISGRLERFPLARVHLRTPYFSGYAEACILNSPVSDVIIGQMSQVTPKTEQEIHEWYGQEGILHAGSVMTRAQHKQHKQRIQEDLPLHNINLDDYTPQNETNRQQTHSQVSFTQTEQTDDPHRAFTGTSEKNFDFAEEQRQDSSLRNCFKRADKSDITKAKNGQWFYYTRNNILYRHFANALKSIQQLVLPTKYREQVLDTSHNKAYAGHMGIKKTLSKIHQHFFWPGISTEVKKYINSCPVCQKMVRRGTVRKIPVQTSTLADRPLHKCSFDLVGPVAVPSARGHRYILTFIDWFTRYPEAIALRFISAEDVCEALLSIFYRLGFPQVLLSDHGPQFTSETMKAFTDMLNIKHEYSAIYHPQSNGTIEVFHKHLKEMLAKTTHEHPENWDKVLPGIIYAYRETQHTSTGYSPHELMFGRSMRSVLSIMHDIWVQPEPSKMTYNAFVEETKKNIITSCNIAKQNLAQANKTQQHYVNLNRKMKSLQEGDLVLVMLPDLRSNTLISSWQGPFKVIKRTSEVDYMVDVNSKHKVFHKDMLREFKQRVNQEGYTDGQEGYTDNTDTQPTYTGGLGIITDIDSAPDITDEIPFPVTQQTETWEDIKICEDIPQEYKHRITTLLKTYADIMTDIPGKTTQIQHTIILTDPTPVKVKQYPIPIRFEAQVKQEVRSLLSQGIIELSESPYNCPLLPIKKKDGTIRLCIDFRKVNSISQVHNELMPIPELLFNKVAKAKVFSKLDLSKGYFQIPLSEDSKQYTAFSTDENKYQFCYLPFGISGAPGTFTRLIKKLISGRNDVVFFIDDILIHHESLEDHCLALEDIFDRLHIFGLTVRPSKSIIAMSQVIFLGFKIGYGSIQPEDSVLTKILNIEYPKTKRQVRSILGLINVYSRFIPCYSDIVSDLCALTKKNAPNTVVWHSRYAEIISLIQKIFSSSPILKIPDPQLIFYVFTDASSTAVSAVLTQIHDNIFHPTYYASRLLTSAEKSYTIQEAECLAVIFALKRFRIYLTGTHFVLMCDNKNLQILTTGTHSRSNRVIRWSMLLQEYSFTVNYIHTQENVLAESAYFSISLVLKRYV